MIKNVEAYFLLKICKSIYIEYFSMDLQLTDFYNSAFVCVNDSFLSIEPSLSTTKIHATSKYLTDSDICYAVLNSSIYMKNFIYTKQPLG